MILGVGIDVVAIGEFDNLLATPHSTFEAQTFTPGESEYSRSTPSNDPARHLAARYAAKEAVVKALDGCFARARRPRQQVSLREIEVVNDAHGRPWLRMHGEMSTILEAVGCDRAWLSMTHDGDTAAAVVVLERLGASDRGHGPRR